MKQLLFLLLFPYLAMAQYQGNGNQKITLGEQSTADGLVFRGIRADTASKIVPFSDTSAYIILDTMEKTLWLYKAGQIPKWQQVGGSTLDTATMLLPYYRAGRNGIIQAADVPTLNQNTTGSAATLTTARNIRINLASAFGANFDGSANITPGVTGVLGAGNGGTGASNFGSPNRIPFVSSSGSLTTDTFFAYNGTTQRLGVGVPNPTEKLHVSGNGLFTGSMSLGTPLTVANGGTGQSTLTSNKVMVGNETSGVLTPTNLHWDNTNSRLGIGVANPLSSIHTNGILTTGSTNVGYINLKGFLWGTTGLEANYRWQSDALVSDNLNFYSRSYGDAFRLAYSTGAVRIFNLSGSGSRVVNAAADGTLSASSSITIKENVNNLNYGLDKILQLQPKSFNYIDKNKYGEGLDIGFIAEDVYPIVPEATGTMNDGFIYFDAVKLIPILTKAIQEQQALIKALEQRLLILENK